MMNDAKVIALPAEGKQLALRRWLIWGCVVAAPLVLPLILHSRYSISMMSQMGIAIILALSYNMLLGQSGLLSFGHAVYSGLGGYATIHILNFVSAGKFSFPITLLPLFGGLTGILFGLLFGYVTTKRSGTVFAMITLGVAELVGAASLVLPGFGGEGGISGNRMTTPGLFGITYGPGIQVYYLIAAWVLVCVALMFALTRTPLGRMANAVRDNMERAQFVGYNPQRIRFIMFVLSAFFAGIGGGLSAINYEIVSQEYLSGHASSGPLLMAFIGGAGYFFGPILGAILVTFLQMALGAYTKAWPIYMGIIFISMVIFAPQGMAGIVMQHRQAWKSGLIGRLLTAYGKAFVPLLSMALGTICVVEFCYHLSTNVVAGTTVKLFGIAVDVATPLPWLAAALLIGLGFFFFHRSRAVIAEKWESVMSELQRRQAQ